jgi:predicted DNA-binding transcriptional regulator AlpA
MRPAHRTLHRRADITRDRDRRANTELEAGKQYSVGELPEIQLLDEHEVSRRLSVSVNTLRYWRACGDGPNYVKLGRLVRYDSGALEKFILRNLRVSKARATAEEKRVAL